MSEHPSEHVDSYVDGDLDGTARKRLHAHLVECARCRRDVDDLRALREQTARLPVQMRPARDLWTGVLSRLEPRERRAATRPAWRGPLLVAAVLLLALVGIFDRHGVRLVEGTNVNPAQNADVILATFDPAEREVSAAAADLVSELHRRRGTPAAQAASALVRNLSAVNSAIDVLREALQANPGDVAIVRRLRKEYQHKTSLI
ncbi:MAG: zf-HC2 domain-containing protein [Candidatus Eisenbacteria bacterium]|nr:zf-HC2 domain-containing protein [Candidatus Eisenbacteria bacterium]